MVSSIKKVGTLYEVSVKSDKIIAKYHSLTTVSVAQGQEVRVGDIIGFQTDSSTSSSGCPGAFITKTKTIFFSGDATSTYQNDLLIGATEALFKREGNEKSPDGTDDSYSFDPITGTITTTELMPVDQRFSVTYTQNVNLL